MKADGSWQITASTPVGPQSMHLHVVTRGDTFTGRIESPMGDLDVSGTVKGDSLQWVTEITKPMSMKVAFDVTVDGDAMSGIAKMGFLGKAKLSGVRVAAQSVEKSSSRATQQVGPVTGDSVDPKYNEPYVEVREWRTSPEPHCYVHGGFKGTNARFSCYFPPKERYHGRFFHNTYPLATTSDIAPFPIAFDVATGDLGFTLASGAYYVQTNLGGADRMPPADPAIAAYRVNAAAAKYSRVVAAEIYGEHRPFGYLFGGSGGSYQVMGAAENTNGVWDGFVPFVVGTPNAVPSMFTVRLHALRVLKCRNKFPGIVDALAPGGSGDPYAGLDEEERGALVEASRMGYPLRGWYNHETLTGGYFYSVAPLVPMLDPTYVEDFWSKPGYLGTDPKSSIAAARFTFDTTIARVLDAPSRQFELADVPRQSFDDAHLVMQSGAAAGQSIPIASIDGRTVGFAMAANHAVINTVRAGDRVRIDNSWPLALQTYHRHQVPGRDMCAWDQFRAADGTPLYPQRDILIGPIGAAGTAGSVPAGRIHGKMLMVQCLMDIDALPWQADWYRSKVRESLGAEFANQYALYFIDHAQHDNPATLQAKAHTVSFAGALQQALRDVSAWVEKGVRPSDTCYEVVDSQVRVPLGAEERKGIQPVIELQANGGVRADVRVNESVVFTATIDVPPNAGAVVSVEWDFEGAGTYPLVERLSAPQTSIRRSVTRSFEKQGTYFAVLRATSQREGDPATPYGRVQNIARVRIVVAVY